MEDYDSLASQTNTGLSWLIWDEIRETYKAIHYHHNNSLVEVLDRVQSFVFHAKCVAGNNYPEDNVKDESGDLKEQRVPAKYAKDAYYESSYEEVPVVDDEASIFGAEILPKRAKPLLEYFFTRLYKFVVLPANKSDHER